MNGMAGCRGSHRQDETLSTYVQRRYTSGINRTRRVQASRCTTMDMRPGADLYHWYKFGFQGESMDRTKRGPIVVDGISRTALR